MATATVSSRAAANGLHPRIARLSPRTRRGVEGPLSLRSSGPSTPQSHYNYTTIYWPTFTPPHWPGFAPSLTLGPVRFSRSGIRDQVEPWPMATARRCLDPSCQLVYGKLVLTSLRLCRVQVSGICDLEEVKLGAPFSVPIMVKIGVPGISRPNPGFRCIDSKTCEIAPIIHRWTIQLAEWLVYVN
jgi:hypothetical protein